MGNSMRTALEALGLMKHPGEKDRPPEPPAFNRRAADKPVGERQLRKMYDRPRSFCDKLPWIEYQDEEGVFLFDDGISVGAMLDVDPVGTEGRSLSWKVQVRDAIERALQDSFEEYDENAGPWVVQFYSYDQTHLDAYLDQLRHYVWPHAQGTQFSETFLDTMASHVRGAAKPGGLFQDPLSETAWSARVRRVHIAIYRRRPAKFRHQSGLSPQQECNEAVSRFSAALSSAGVRVRRMDGAMFHDWLFRWFNPRPEPVADAEAFYQANAYVPMEQQPFGHTDFAEGLLTAWPRSDLKSQTWWFDGMPHRCVTTQKLRRVPDIGHLSGECKVGSNIGGSDADSRAKVWFDALPEGSLLCQTVMIIPQDTLENYLNYLDGKSVGETAESEQTREDVSTAKTLLATGHKLFKSSLVIYLRGQDLPDLRSKFSHTCNLMQTAGILPLRDEEEQCALDAYLLHLPMAYDPLLDTKTKFLRYTYAQHIANLAPVFGRATGTGNPGLNWFNRGGAPLTFDPLNLKDRKKNGHMLLLGPTGAGKSASLVTMIAQLLGIARPRIFIIEAGNSFGLLADYCAGQGLSVNKVALKPGAGVAIPPFADAHLLLQQARSPNKEALADLDTVETLTEEDQEGDEQRDIMGEMEIIAMLMITGGDEREVEKFDRADRRVIRDAILAAARTAVAANRQTLTGDVRDALLAIAHAPGEEGERSGESRRRIRAEYMSQCIDLFCDGFEGELFNREGELWPEVDVTLIDLATYAREGYSAQLAVAYTSIMNRINNLAEKYQYDDRPLIMITDEGHIITTNPLLSPYVVKVVKMWRKLGAWYWVATQNLEDFPNVAKKLLNMIEWWILLVMPKEEVEQVARFRDLSPAQREMMLAARKEPGKYTEGVVLSSALEALFRSVPPSLHLALAMTEKDEKVERRKLMREHNITEVEAAVRVAQRLDQKRGLAG